MIIALYSVATISGVIGLCFLMAALFGSGSGSKVHVSYMAMCCLVFSLFWYTEVEKYQEKLEEVNPATEIIDSVIDHSEK